MSMASEAFDGMLELREVLLGAGYKLADDDFVPSVVRTVKQILEALIDERDPKPPTQEWADRVTRLLAIEKAASRALALVEQQIAEAHIPGVADIKLSDEFSALKGALGGRP